MKPQHLPYALADAARIGRQIALHLRVGDVVTLAGPLGAGKTTLARAILAALGLPGEAPSPTFAIVQPYAPPEVSLPVAHVDLYRIEDPAELIELGLDDYVSDGALLIEWPERLGNTRWAGTLALEIVGDGDARVLTATVPPAWAARWPLA